MNPEIGPDKCKEDMPTQTKPRKDKRYETKEFSRFPIVWQLYVLGNNT